MFSMFHSSQRLLLECVVILTFLSSGNRTEASDNVSFEHDVMAVLSKSGCNSGACHGNQNGKGGFKLSLRGQDPKADLLSLTHEGLGRRANSIAPDSSLLLLKPTMGVAHEGGLRFRRDSLEYNLLRDWMRNSARHTRSTDSGSTDSRLIALNVTPETQVLAAPQHDVALKAIATFADGTKRDVTRLAVFEPSTPSLNISLDGLVKSEGAGEATVVVRYLHLQHAVRLAWLHDRGKFEWRGPAPSNLIDSAVFAKLRLLQINPSDRCDDTTFIRRVTLDLTGSLPTVAEAMSFLQDTGSHKREQLVERLLQTPAYSSWWALKWSDMLRNEEKTLDRKGVQNFHAWIREAVEGDLPLNQFAGQLIAARGSTYVQPASNYYRSLRDPFARSEATAQLFLGIRLQCAKCHNHPFDKWTQDDYYSWGNVFSQIDYKILDNNRRDTNDSHEFDGEQIVLIRPESSVNDPRLGKPQPARLLGENLPVADGADRLEALSTWLSTTGRRQFARVMVNRVWAHLMGRGIVEPVDDFRATNPPVNPKLLETLADDLIQNNFSLKHLLKSIVGSETYQLSAVPNESNRDDDANFSKAQVRRLTAEQLLDAMSLVTGSRLNFNGYPTGFSAKELPGVFATRSRDRKRTAEDQFLRIFGKPQRLQSCECERVAESTLSQAFQLVSGELMNEILADPKNRLIKFVQMTDSNNQEAVISELYWSALSRPPKAEEINAIKRFLDSAVNRRQAIEDLTWGLLNSDEFLLRR